MDAAVSAAAGGATRTGLPSGNVAFLFTDIEGSTVRWDRDAPAMTQAVRRHDAIMRTAIAAHDGHVFKTIGDAFCAVFWTIADGVSAVLDAQRTLAQEDFGAVDGIRVRMALHVGTSDERDGDYFGPTLNRVARLLAIGHGQQVLLSTAAAELLALAMPDIALRDMGEHRLKDLTAAEHVFQLLADDLPTEFPKLKSLSVLNNNLPQQLTSLVGRDREITEIRALVDKHRLVTLSGSGGVGKTRCALQAGAEALDGFSDGVWFADLAPLTDASLIANVIAEAFELQEQPDQPMLAALVAHLKHKQTLLIIDNCEHLVHDASKTIDALLRGCPKVSVLATSREALAIHGETLYRMPSLATPGSSRGLTAERALSFGAVALFNGRAGSANPNYRLTDELVPVVCDICRRLDGIPLAIELAAARVKVLSVPSLAQRLDERFKILTGGSRTALPRQQTMRALIDWSYDLLTEREKELFRFISIFSGSFALDAATSVCADKDIDDIEMLDLLTSLVDKSLVQADDTGHDVRYRMLESTRQYAREKLVERGEADAIARRHAEAYVAISEELDRGWDTMPDRDWLARAEPEMENWRAAIAWALGSDGESTIGQRLAVGLCWLEFARVEGRRYVHAGLEKVTDQTPPHLVADLHIAASKLDSLLLSFKSSLSAAQRALDVLEASPDAGLLANAQLCAGRALVCLGRPSEGEPMLQSALTTFRAAGLEKAIANTLFSIGYACALKGDMPSAREVLREAAAIYDRTGAEERLPAVLTLLAEAEFRTGDTQTAVMLATRGLAASRTIKNPMNLMNLLPNLAAYLITLSKYDEARSHAREALVLARDEQAEMTVMFTLQHLAAIAALRDDESLEERSRAAQLIGFVNARLQALDAQREHTEQQEYEAVSAALGARLGAPRFEELVREGALWTPDRAIDEAQAIL
ncbi:MAG: AAA family ATPase [Candidatus Eremiobacteraeota bacterium]|nr:AAA family ATPase [Candidatus Eremiobacteraeota bacterium]